MLQVLRGGRLPAWMVAAAICVTACPAAEAKDSFASVTDAERYIATGDLKAAAIELKNAVSQAPQDPAIRAQLALVYFQLDDFTSAIRNGPSVGAKDLCELEQPDILRQ